MTLLLIHTLSSALFLILFMLCAWLKEGNKLMTIPAARVFGSALTPVLNIYVCVCMTVLLVMIAYEYYLDREFRKIIKDLK